MSKAQAGTEPVVHLQKQGVLAKPKPGYQRKVCVSCECPIAVYGRILPCLHTFCQPCSASMAVCMICEGPIESIEFVRHGDQPLFISAATLQSFKSERSSGAYELVCFICLLVTF